MRSFPYEQTTNAMSSNGNTVATNSNPQITQLDSKYQDVTIISYRLNYMLKRFDITLDIAKLIQEPTLDNFKVFAYNAFFFGAMFIGPNNYLPLVTAFNIASFAYNGEYSAAGCYSLGLFLWKNIAGESFAPLYGTLVFGFNIVKTVSNAIDFFSNWGCTNESLLKSDFAYADLHYFLKNKDNAKSFLYDANMIVAKDFEEYHNHDSVIQKLAKENDLQGKLCSWFDHCFCDNQ